MSEVRRLRSAVRETGWNLEDGPLHSVYRGSLLSAESRFRFRTRVSTRAPPRSRPAARKPLSFGVRNHDSALRGRLGLPAHPAPYVGRTTPADRGSALQTRKRTSTLPSDDCLLTSDFRLLISDLRPPTSDLRPRPGCSMPPLRLMPEPRSEVAFGELARGDCEDAPNDVILGGRETISV